MNQLQLHQALHSLLKQSSRIASIRIAVRWLKANLMSDAKNYDIFFRLQILEGALGAREGQWWIKGRAGLVEAAKAAEGLNLSPDWLDSGNTGMFRLLYNSIENHINRHGVSALSPDDIIQSALMGMGVNNNTTKKPAYEAGVKNSAKIKNGDESPKSIAVGTLSKWLVRKVINEAVYNKQILQNNEESGYSSRSQVRHNEEGVSIFDTLKLNKNIEEESLKYLINLFFFDRNNPISKKVRNFMKETWEGTQQEKMMDIWLETIQKKQRPVKQKITEQAGVPPQDFVGYFRTAWKRFFMKLKRNTSLVRLLDNHLASLGLEFSLPAKTEDILPPILRTAFEEE